VAGLRQRILPVVHLFSTVADPPAQRGAPARPNRSTPRAVWGMLEYPVLLIGSAPAPAGTGGGDFCVNPPRSTKRNGHTIALDESALLELLEALKLADVDDRIRMATKTLYQALIEAELTTIEAAPHERTESARPSATTHDRAP
jgi:hypothetical protein